MYWQILIAVGLKKEKQTQKQTVRRFLPSFQFYRVIHSYTKCGLWLHMKVGAFLSYHIAYPRPCCYAQFHFPWHRTVGKLGNRVHFLAKIQICHCTLADEKRVAGAATAFSCCPVLGLEPSPKRLLRLSASCLGGWLKIQSVRRYLYFLLSWHRQLERKRLLRRLLVALLQGDPVKLGETGVWSKARFKKQWGNLLWE